MDIAELTQKMESTPLVTKPKCSSYLKPVASEAFSPRLTRSKTNKGEKSLQSETEVPIQSKRNHSNFDDVEKLYLNKKPKVVHKNLETIYEDPVWKKGSTILLGTAKVKRSIYLDREFRIITKQKSKLRKMKIKRLGRKIKKFKMSEEEFKNHMLRIENYLNENNVELESRNEDCDVEFGNCDSNENGNSESGVSESSVSENKDSGNEFMSE